jgi:carbon storage regulator
MRVIAFRNGGDGRVPKFHAANREARTMLVLSRKKNELIQIGESITITVIRADKNRVRLGIEAPRGMRVVRPETGQPRREPHSQDQKRVPTTRTHV